MEIRRHDGASCLDALPGEGWDQEGDSIPRGRKLESGIISAKSIHPLVESQTDLHQFCWERLGDSNMKCLTRQVRLL